MSEQEGPNSSDKSDIPFNGHSDETSVPVIDPKEPYNDLVVDSEAQAYLSRRFGLWPQPPRQVPVVEQARFPEFPAGWLRPDHPWYYAIGWPTNDSWFQLRLKAFGNFSRRRAKDRQQPLKFLDYSDLSRFSKDLVELRARARFKHIYECNVVPLDCADPEKTEPFEILMLWHTSCETGGPPPHLTYMWLYAILGSKPQWYIDPVPAKRWNQTPSFSCGLVVPEMEYYRYEKQVKVMMKIGDDEDVLGGQGGGTHDTMVVAGDAKMEAA
ncbi:hypothetical protein BD413DRAFT_63135 [Trametes elegans]|nr:hypothetical protein BD413DRAFT_63135 [Trametes elegans]